MHGYPDRTSPLYVLIRLGCVFLVCASLYWMERQELRLPRSVRTAGQESLLVYGFQLFVIFGVPRGKHLGPILGLEAGWAVSLALSAAIILLMLRLAGKWQWLKRTYPDPVKRAQAGIVLIALMLFLA